MRWTTSARLRALASGLLVIVILAACAATAAAETIVTHYTTEYTSAYGKVLCTGTLVTNKRYPGDATEGGREREKCNSQEPGGKLTGYFTPGETYTGYWESDYYATIGRDGVQPTSVTIKVAKSFRSFTVVSAVYPFAGS